MTTKDILKKTVGFVSLGCDKNRVDLEKMIAIISNAGFKVTFDINEASIVIINTCSFIESARQESIDTMLNVITYKNSKCEKIIVTGCLNQMNFTDLESSLPEIDAFVKIKDNDNIVNIIYKLYGMELGTTNNCGYDRIITTPSHYSYLKISEGCNNFCSYCTIPFIRGRFVSEPIEKLVAEAQYLADKGVKELILVGQDVTKYGLDLYGEYKIVDLIKELSKINNIKWIRLLYCYPELVTSQLIDEIKTNPKVTKYIDLPLQHVSSKILKSMNRRTDKDKVLSVISQLKSSIPNIAIRTTFILGFPGETKDDYEEVLDFIKEQKLTNVGFFPYSREYGTRAYDFPNQVTTSIKNSRVKKAYLTQQKVVENNNINLLNQVLDVIIDSVDGDYFVTRSYMSAPEVDTVIYVPYSDSIEMGSIIKVKITKVIDYDLEGELYESSK